MKINIRSPFIICIIMFAFGFHLNPAASGDFASANQPTVCVVPSNISNPDLNPSMTFTILVRILDVTDLAGFDIRLRWDPSLLNYSSHSVKVPVEDYPSGVLHEPAFVVKDEVNTTLGTYWVAYATIGGPSFSGSGTVFEMNFTVLSYGSCALDIYRSDLSDPAAQAISHVVENGYFSNAFYDVAILSVTPSSTGITIGDTANITVTVLNNGTTRNETFNVTVYYNNTQLTSDTVIGLSPHTQDVLVFQWDTNGFPAADYVISANATTVQGETVIQNNRLENGLVILVDEQIHDVALTALTPFKTVVFNGYCFSVNVTLENQGNLPEVFNITLYANNVAINRTEVVLERGVTITVKFAWRVDGVTDYTDYLLNATTDQLNGEIDVDDNSLFFNGVKAVHPGDFDVDEDVDIFDIVMIASAYAVQTGNPRYDPNLDVNCDGKIDIFDVVMIAPFYGYERV